MVWVMVWVVMVWEMVWVGDGVGGAGMGSAGVALLVWVVLARGKPENKATKSS